MANLGDRIADRFMTHNISLLRFEGGQRRTVLGLLRTLETQLIAALYAHDPTAVTRTAFQQRRLEALLVQVTQLIRTAYRDMHSGLRLDLQELARLEAQATVQIVNGSVGVPLLSVGVDEATLRALAETTLVHGAPLKEWWAQQAGTLRQRFANAMRQGIVLGEPLERLVQRLRGTRAMAYSDGLMQLSRRAAETLARTATLAVANAAREAVYREHADLLEGVEWTAVLDRRACLQCAPMDGLAFALPQHTPQGHDIRWPGPPPLHPACRCTMLPVLRSWADLVQDPEMSPRLRQALQRLPASSRASMDGQVSSTLHFEGWLKTKPEAFQQDVLGRGRWDLWRRGQISFTDLIDQRARPLTLAQLRQHLADDA